MLLLTQLGAPGWVAAQAAVPDIRIEPLSIQFSSPLQGLRADVGESSTLHPGAGGGATAVEVSVSAGDPALERAVRTVPKGGRLNVRGLLLRGDTEASTLELQRFEVWRPDAVVMIGNRRVPAPKTLYFRGSLAGRPRSSVLLSTRETGGMTGMIFRADGAWAIGKGAGRGMLRSKKADPASFKKTFECGVDGLAGIQALLDGAKAFEPPVAGSATALDQPHVATLAVETDYEYYAKFLSQPDPRAAALDYMADLIGYSDLVFSREVDIDITIGFARLWDGGAGTDPWNVTSDTLNALYELRGHWNSLLASVPRTITHMLSGKGLGGGIAWLNVLCDNYEHPGESFDYGLSANLEASFSWDGDESHDPGSLVWDIIVVQHEIGHNFSSPHTHEYCNIGGSTQPIDGCAAGCAGEATGLPSCSSPTPFFDGGAGTIMSYCHLLQGGVGNIAMTFGEGHTCGTLPGRAADKMSAYVVARTSAFPTCFQPPVSSFTIYNDGVGELTVNSLALETPAAWISWMPAAPYTIPGGGSQGVTVNVDFSLAPAGQTTRRILVSSNDPDESPYPGGVDIVVDRPPAPTCYSLSRTHSGSGSDPSALPASSDGCPSDHYTAGASIQVTASPSAGWSVGSWSGTVEDGSTSTTNTVTMAAGDQTVTVNYVELPSPGAGTNYYTLTPCRILDTRGSGGLESGVTYEVAVTGYCAVPATAAAVAANLTAVGSTGQGHMTFWPAQGSMPGTSNVNFGFAQTRANNAILILAPGFFGAAGAVWVEPIVTGGATVDLVIDVVGYFQ